MSEREELLPVCWLEPAGSRAFTVYDHDPLKPGSFPVYRQPPAPVQVTLPDDLFSHESAWRSAIEEMRDNAPSHTEDGNDDRSYWEHELAVFDRTWTALRALEAALQAGVPSGWKLVPEICTKEMSHAFWAKYRDADRRLEWFSDAMQQAYTAMLAAAPAPGEGR